jgi:hypothetical protein
MSKYFRCGLELFDRHKAFASQRGLSLNKLFEDFSVKALAEFDSENRFRIRAGCRDKAKGLAILDGLDRKHKI